MRDIRGALATFASLYPALKHCGVTSEGDFGGMLPHKICYTDYVVLNLFCFEKNEVLL